LEKSKAIQLIGKPEAITHEYLKAAHFYAANLSCPSGRPHEYLKAPCPNASIEKVSTRRLYRDIMDTQ
jgi:hypothetical protein